MAVYNPTAPPPTPFYGNNETAFPLLPYLPPHKRVGSFVLSIAVKRNNKIKIKLNLDWLRRPHILSYVGEYCGLTLTALLYFEATQF